MTNHTKIAYLSEPSPWLTLEFENVAINTLVIAIIAMLISHQLTAIVYDLILGTKKKNVSPIHAFFTLLLVRESSFIAVLNSILRKDWLTRLYYLRHTQRSGEISRDEEKVRPSVFLRVCVLLLAAPVLNILVISLSLENSRDLSFGEARLNGIAFGVNPDLSVIETESENERCERTLINTKSSDQLLGDFSLCSPSMFSEKRWDYVGHVAIYIFDNKTFYLHVQVGNFRFILPKLAAIHANGTDFLIRAELHSEGLSAVLDRGTQLVAEACGTDIRNARDKRLVTNSRTLEFIAAREVSCMNQTDSEKKAIAVLKQFGKYFTLIPANTTRVVLWKKNSILRPDASYFIGDEIILLRRRERYVGLVPLAVLGVVSVLVRFILAIFWNNDVGEGVQLIVKNIMGFQFCSSLLHEGDRTINFRYTEDGDESVRHEE